MLGRQFRRVFDEVWVFTIGVEEELMLVEPETLELLEVADLACACARAILGSRASCAPPRSR